ncbi:MAG: TonB-dependent receptor domain-containing protein [Bacteroidia bacterium]
MLRRFSLFLIVLITLGQLALAQDGKITGKVLDSSGQPAPYAAVMLMQGETVVNGAYTDDNGVYSIQPVEPGKYDVKVQVLEVVQMVTGVEVNVGETRNLDVAFQQKTDATIDEVLIIEFKRPPFSKEAKSGSVVNGEEFQKMGTRNIQALAAITPGVYAGDENDGAIAIKGARASATTYFVDGVKIRGNVNLPQKAIGQFEVITGGTPPEFGDFTGGAVNITTAAPATSWNGGIEAVTSELLDAYGRNLVALNLSGPILTRKETMEVNGKTLEFTKPLLGTFISGEWDFNRDADPGFLGIYKLNDDKLKQIQDNPLVLATDGSNFRPSAAYVTDEDMMGIKAKPFNRDQRARVLARLDFQPTDNILVKYGVNYENINTDQYSLANALFSPDPRSKFQANALRTWLRFQQSFRNDSGTLRNFFYSIQGDYSSYDRKFYHQDFRENLWDYGYVGKFSYDINPRYSYISDPIGDPGSSGGYWKTAGYQSTNLQYDDANTRNSIYANYNNYIFDYVNNGGMFATYGLDNVQNLDLLRFFSGIRNGDGVSSVYGLYSAPGSQAGGYTKASYQQYRLTGQTTAELKGKNSSGSHNIKAGFEFEQRDERFYSLGARNLWTFARLFANSHLATLNTDPTSWDYVTSGGEFQDTVNIPLKYDALSQTTFDKKLREKLGKAIDGTELLKIDEYDPSTFDVNMFSADELLFNGNGIATYYGYDAWGNKQKRVDPKNFFTDKNRPQNAFRPTYISAFLQDKFELKDIIFNVGLRVDRFDANQLILKDAYSLFATRAADETVTQVNNNPNASQKYTLPSNADDSWVAYVDDIKNPKSIVGYRSGDTWYDANGVPTSSKTISNLSGGTVKPHVAEDSVGGNAFVDYKPQTIFMPRISFSFPITDEAVFFAHYDVLAQRPGQNGAAGGSLLAGQLSDYYFLAKNPTVDVLNPNLKPEITIDYEAGFRQKIGENSALVVSAYYREMRNMIQSRRYQDAYPITYNSFDNIDFGTTKGFSFSYDMQRYKGLPLQLRASYTLQFATATGSGFSSSRNVNDILQGTSLLRTLLPTDIDQRHRFTGVADYRFVGERRGPGIKTKKKVIYPLEDFGINLTFNLGSGTPFSRQGVVGSIQSGLVQASQLSGTALGSRLPWQFRADLRFDKNIAFGGKKVTGKDGKERTTRAYDMNVYLLFLNLLNTQNIVGVYGYTGLPFDDGFLESEQGQQQIQSQISATSFRDMYSSRLQNPNNVSVPRRIRLGVMFNF